MIFWLRRCITCIFLLDSFDLKEFALIDFKLINSQIIAAVLEIAATLIFTGVRGYIQTKALSSAAEKAEADGISRLKFIFPKGKQPKRHTLQAYVQDAQKIVNEKSGLHFQKRD